MTAWLRFQKFSILFNLFPLRKVKGVGFGFEIFKCEFGNGFWIIGRTAKDVEVNRFGRLRKVGGNERRLDKLGHTKAIHPGIIAKVDDLGLSVAFHLDQVEELVDKSPDAFRILH